MKGVRQERIILLKIEIVLNRWVEFSVGSSWIYWKQQNIKKTKKKMQSTPNKTSPSTIKLTEKEVISDIREYWALKGWRCVK
ncbi:hypothetical protein DP116_23300 [Brasilonema bromeliae SPC951]|uniref:Uncharacterized protein n=1 Tax=Brasilonema bromeliae SPC951 TaxID=385972 RepID=A0ABX1PFF9_9CYAN|nr:hypothetical protein [Brasilonema bromeliae SPC951]